MRTTTTVAGLAAALLTASLATTASAQRSGGGETKQGRGGSSAASGATGNGPGGGNGVGAPDRYLGADEPDELTLKPVKRKFWELSAGFEVHRLIRQEDSGNGSSKLLNVYEVGGEIDPSKYDHIKLRWFMSQRFIADSGESGFRSEDMILSYTRYVPLKYEFTWKPGLWVTFPTSLGSEKAGTYTSPRVFMSLEKDFGRYLRVEPRGYGEANITKYREYEGGSQGVIMNPKFRTGFGLSAEFSMPFHTPLSLGADVATGYTWYYQPNNGDPNMSGSFVGTVDDNRFGAHEVQQTYGGEIFVRYIMPTLAGFKSDATLALADGNPSLGYTTVLHDGVARFYGAFRSQAEVYATFSVRY